jgi:hypothetical protein
MFCKKRHSQRRRAAAPAVLAAALAVLLFAPGRVSAADDGAYLAATNTHYLNPDTGVTDDGGTQNAALGEGMCRSVVYEKALVELDGDKIYLTVRLQLMSNMRDFRLYIQDAPGGGYSKAAARVMAEDASADTADYRFAVPSVTSYVSWEMYVIPMGRDVKFYMNVSDELTAGSGDFIVTVKPKAAPSPSPAETPEPTPPAQPETPTSAPETRAEPAAPTPPAEPTLPAPPEAPSSSETAPASPTPSASPEPSASPTPSPAVSGGDTPPQTGAPETGAVSKPQDTSAPPDSGADPEAETDGAAQPAPDGDAPEISPEAVPAAAVPAGGAETGFGDGDTSAREAGGASFLIVILAAVLAAAAAAVFFAVKKRAGGK